MGKEKLLKRRSPQDLTLRNLKAAKKRDLKLSEKISGLEWGILAAEALFEQVFNLIVMQEARIKALENRSKKK